VASGRFFTMRLFDSLSKFLAAIGAWAFFVVGLMLSYEVIARYLFNAPTKWAAELSTLLLVWGTFLAAAALLHNGHHIRISLVTEHLPRMVQHRLDALIFLLVAGFCGVVVWYGTPIAYDSYETGRTTGSMLNIPTFWTELSVPVGFALLGVQALIETIRALGRGENDTPSPKPHEGD